MIFNPFSVVAAFAAFLRVAVGLLVVGVGIAALVKRRRSPAGAEGRFHLQLILAATLLGLVVVSWPLFYLVLRSYVPEWPGIMCIQGVTRIGTGSVGAVAYLPALVAALEIAKPALVFLAGAWLALHLATRSGGTRVLTVLVGFGLLAALDGGAEAAYLLIPKQENVVSVGCCSTPGAVAAVTPAFADAPASHGGLTAAFFLLGAGIVVALSLGWRRIALAGAVASLPVGLHFLRLVAAPLFLRLPYHRCVYCLFESAPEAIVGIALFLLGAFATGWSILAHSPRLARIARFGYAGALLMAAVRLLIR